MKHHSIVIPPFLKVGSKIGIMCPSSTLYQPVLKCVETLQQWGFVIELGKTVGTAYYNFSAPDDIRLKELQYMLDSNFIDAILCARGGYGVSRIIDQIDWTGFKKHPKWFIGFSDITLLLLHIYQTCGIASLHSLMTSAFNTIDDMNQQEYIYYLKDVLMGETPIYQCSPHVLNKCGKARGRIVGGNLSMLIHTIGTVSQPYTEGCILFIEDIDEYQYRIDRMMIQLKRAGILSGLVGCIIGSFTHVLHTRNGFGKEVYEMIAEHFASYSFPIAYQFPIGHQVANVPIQVGMQYELLVEKTGAQLTRLML